MKDHWCANPKTLNLKIIFRKYGRQVRLNDIERELPERESLSTSSSRGWQEIGRQKLKKIDLVIFLASDVSDFDSMIFVAGRAKIPKSIILPMYWIRWLDPTTVNWRCACNHVNVSFDIFELLSLLDTIETFDVHPMNYLNRVKHKTQSYGNSIHTHEH